MQSDSFYDRKYGREPSPINPKAKLDDPSLLAKRTRKAFKGGVDELIEMAVKEMGERLAENPQAVPAHVLVKFVAEANRAADRKKEQEKEEQKKPERSLLEQLPSLPKCHAQRLIKDEIARLRDLLEVYLCALVDINNQEKG